MTPQHHPTDSALAIVAALSALVWLRWGWLGAVEGAACALAVFAGLWLARWRWGG